MTTQIILPEFEKARVLVYGDVMLDRYWHGIASRISPEAPVPIVNVLNTETRPGGAANVAHNIAALGAQITLFGVVGNDHQAQELKEALQTSRVNCQFLTIPDFSTITKLRVLGNNQQLIRMDFEKNDVGEKEIQDDALFFQYQSALQNVHVVVLSDYSKGALCHVERLILAAKKQNVKILIDPKHKNYMRYSGATILTPNLKEFESVVGKCRDLKEVTQKAKQLLRDIHIDSVLVTLGKDGMIYVNKNTDTHFPVKARDVFDVTGAGDTVIGVFAAGLAAEMDILSAIELANVAAGIVVGKLGAYAVSVSDLQKAISISHFSPTILNESQLLSLVAQAKMRQEKIVMTNGCFDILHAGHVAYLTKAKTFGDRLIVAINDDASVRHLKGEDRPLNSLSARMEIIAALKAVDWAVSFSEETPARLIERVKPDILVKGSDYQPYEIAGADCVVKNGGKVVTIPLAPGFSTTKLIETIKGVTV